MICVVGEMEEIRFGGLIRKKVATIFGNVATSTLSLDSKCSYMAKTNPIGVRFDEKVLERFKKMEINSPQKALNFMEGLFMRTTDDIGKIVAENNKPENKAKIEAERNGTANNTKKEFKQPLTPKECTATHKLWKEGDPKEHSTSFWLKYECYTYEELEKLKTTTK